VALFTDTEPDFPVRRHRGRTIGWALVALAIIGLVIVGTMPAPYVIEQPGPVFNTLGSATYNKAQRPLITIAKAKTYPTSGTLDMLTVNIAGSPDSRPSWAQIAGAWFDPSQAVVPIDEIYAPQQSVKQSNAESAAEMTGSQQSATAAALHELGIAFVTTIGVASTVKGLPAAGILKAGDVIESINGKKFIDTDSIRNAVVANGTHSAMTVRFTRGGKQKTATLTPRSGSAGDPQPAIGVLLTEKYKFPIDVTIQLQDVGGPSAGMMFALGIIDKLTPGALTGGRHIAGTGEIDASGTVGAIGGIRQKMYGARNAGAKYFLAPASNCTGDDGVVGHIPSGLTVFATSSLHQSMTALKAIASGKGLSALPTCSAK
jgi:PDZ domain-containing protein